MREAEIIRSELDDLQHVADLRQTRGWKIIEQHFVEVKKAVQDKILIETSYKEIRILQERYRAFNSMLEAVDGLCKIREAKQQELEAIMIEEKERDQYGN